MLLIEKLKYFHHYIVVMFDNPRTKGLYSRLKSAYGLRSVALNTAEYIVNKLWSINIGEVKNEEYREAYKVLNGCSSILKIILLEMHSKGEELFGVKDVKNHRVGEQDYTLIKNIKNILLLNFDYDFIIKYVKDAKRYPEIVSNVELEEKDGENLETIISVSRLRAVINIKNYLLDVLRHSKIF